MGKQFSIHRIPDRMDAIDNPTRICGHTSPPWLHTTIIKLYKQMDEIRLHAEKKCRKILCPESDYSPRIWHWYDKIHAYLTLLFIQAGNHKYTNAGNAHWFSKRHSIDNPRDLTLQELKDDLQSSRIRQKELRKQAKSLWKVHL